jgi:hypothetical protein
VAALNRLLRKRQKDDFEIAFMAAHGNEESVNKFRKDLEEE